MASTGAGMRGEMRERIRHGRGFIAALDQSGGSTPKALRLYGVPESSYADEAAMFDRIHEMRVRILTSPVFSGQRIIGAILFEQTMERPVDGLGAAEYLWARKRIVPFLKVDRGLAEESDGAQRMKPIPDLDALLGRALAHGVFGTKMRSVISLADERGISGVVAQQFELAQRILDTGLVPIIEPEVGIGSPEKARAEALLRDALEAGLDALPPGREVMLKLTLPSTPGFYGRLVAHPRVLRVAALSGGYSRQEADALLSRNPGLVASFSRALTEGLTAQMTDAEFDATLDASIRAIYGASTTKAA